MRHRARNVGRTAPPPAEIASREDDAEDRDQQRGRSLAVAAYETLEEMIVTLVLPPGSLWSEEALSERIAIGRTPVREAIKRLQANDLLHIMPRQGLMIAEIDHHEQLRLVDFRRTLEMFVSLRAARRALIEERRELVALGQEIEMSADSDDVRQYLRSVLRANLCIAKAAKNPLAARTIASVHALSRRYYFKYHTDLKNLSKVSVLHAARARAIADGDERATQKSTKQLMDTIESYTQEIFSRTMR